MVTIPIISLRAVGTEGVMCITGRAIPVVVAVFIRKENFSFRRTKAVTAVRTLRQRRRVFLLAPRAVPIMVATRIGSVDRHMCFTEPVPVTGHIRRMPIFAVRAPPGVRTILRRCIDAMAIFPVAQAVFVRTIFRFGMTVSMTRTVPDVIAKSFIGGIVSTLTCIVLAIPPSVRTRFDEGVTSVALRTIPAVLAVRFVGGHVMRYMINAPPMMRTTCRFGINPPAIGAIPALILRAVRTDGMVDVTGVAPPIVVAIFVPFQNFPATVAIPPTARTDCIRRMPLRANGAVPGMRTRLSDINRRLAGRAVPAMRIRCGTNVICRVVFVFRRTIPVVRAVFVWREDFIARLAHAITVDIGIRSGMLLLISRTVPGMLTAGIQSVGIFARFAIPTVLTVRIRRVRLPAGWTEPAVIFASFVHRMMLFAARARPVMFTVGILFNDVGTG